MSKTKNSPDIEDTIVAISTPVGTGGIGIVRLSGKNSISIAEKIFYPKNKNKKVSEISSHTITLGEIVDKDKNVVIDEVLMLLMRSPKSYTCEDVVEFSCHSGLTVLKLILELCLKHGARLAEPGEFTKRAFLNGRIDLSQAESVAQLINAKTVFQSQLATRSLLGITKNSVGKIVDNLKNIIAEVEVGIDYPEEENFVNEKKVKLKTEKILSQLTEVIKNSDKLSPIINGLNIAIIGKPNVGKSSLLNILLRHDRAIVSDIPGTTRDTISETINLNNIPVRIVDTAGIRKHSQDVIEKFGMKKTQQAIAESDIVLFMIDAKEGLSEEDYLITKIINKESRLNSKKIIFLINKTDLNPKFDLNKIKTLVSKFKNNVTVITTLKISCKTGRGINELEKVITDFPGIDDKMLNNFLSKESDSGLILTNLRQIELVKNAKSEIENALKIDIKKFPELFCHHLTLATKELLKITGGELEEDVLDIIFSKFCVGK